MGGFMADDCRRMEWTDLREQVRAIMWGEGDPDAAGAHDLIREVTEWHDAGRPVGKTQSCRPDACSHRQGKRGQDMICKPCVERCQTKGGCWGDESEFVCPCDKCGCEQESPEDCLCSFPCFRYRTEEKHHKARHIMVLEGFVYTCSSCGDTAERRPADEMREAGISPMI